MDSIDTPQINALPPSLISRPVKQLAGLNGKYEPIGAKLSNVVMNSDKQTAVPTSLKTPVKDKRKKKKRKRESSGKSKSSRPRKKRKASQS